MSTFKNINYAHYYYLRNYNFFEINFVLVSYICSTIGLKGITTIILHNH